MHQPAEKLANTGWNELIHRCKVGCQHSFSVNAINQFHYSECFREDQEQQREPLELLEEGKEKLCGPFSPTARPQHSGAGGTPAR